MAKQTEPSFWYRNGLSLVFGALVLLTLAGQFINGLRYHNEELMHQYNQLPLDGWEYLTTGHFISATFENWESEFLQMALYVLLTVFLRQKGSSESKSLDEKEEVDREPVPGPDAPWPVRRGGWWLKIYQNSLSLAFALLFLISFILHLYGSWKDELSERRLEGEPPISLGEHLAGNRFWYESFQNWQSEFLSVASIIVLSIFLRQKGSPESKPVDAPNSETGK